ncbi:hypothetical protein B0H13DRAFT_1496400, partial [Mycena leptocephala]
PDPPSLSTLALEKITYTHRAIILHFGTLFFMFQYLTHTSVQFYPREIWERSIRNVSKNVRTFKIAIAFIFSTHVLAFPTLDMVFQPTWATSLTDFVFPPNIYTSTHDYLVLVSKWIEQILLKPRHTRACDAIRGCNDLFYGIGVYTVMELFFMAGLSPFLTLFEVFSNPSRTARFLLAFYSYYKSNESPLPGLTLSFVRSLLKPCIHDGILAPTTEQRLRYADWLYVWAKDRTSLPVRMAGLADAFQVCKSFSGLDSILLTIAIWGRDTECELFDVFEPTFVAASLKSEVNLGHLVFGEDTWVAVGGKRASCDDPITALYRKYGKL